MGKLNYTASQIHDIAKKVMEVKNYIYRGRFDPRAVMYQFLALYSASELKSVYKYEDDRIILVTPKDIYLESTSTKTEIYYMAKDERSSQRVNLGEINEEDISNECEISPYLNNYLLGLEELTLTHYDDLDLNHERKRAEIIADLLAK